MTNPDMNQQLHNITELLRSHVDNALQLAAIGNIPAARKSAANALAEVRLLQHQLKIIEESNEQNNRRVD